MVALGEGAHSHTYALMVQLEDEGCNTHAAWECCLKAGAHW
jgi:hypothetical protein